LKSFYKILLIILGIIISGCASKEQNENESSLEMEEHVPISTIEISDTIFAPVEIVIPRGTEITWANKDDEDHSIKNSLPENFLFESGSLKPNDEYSFSFTQQGTFEYFCPLHPAEKKGIIIVK
jgi:plastocyanin